jgi:fumarate reductase (CoM/CoB) subunit A
MWVKGGGTARKILRVMLQKLRELQVPIEEETMVFELLEKDGAFAGALGVRKNSGEMVYFRAKAVILGTGGAHGIYPHSVASSDMTGDGYAMASRLGLPLANMEFVQCGPGVIWPTLVVLSGPVYRNGPVFVDVNGREIIQDYAPAGVFPVDVVNKKVYPYTVSDISTYLDIAIYRRMKEGPATEHGGVYMDLRGKADLPRRLPVTTAKLKLFGIDPMTQLLETGIVTQCMNGGVCMENADAATAVCGVYVVGEAAGGVRGPDRPGGNSLCECQVFGNRAGKAAALYAKSGDYIQTVEPVEDLAQHKTRSLRENGKFEVGQVIETIRKTMWENCLIIRNEQGLRSGLSKIAALSQEVIGEGLSCGRQNIMEALGLLNMLDVAGIIMTAALAREESRGPHYREDYPAQNDAEWKRIIYVRRNGNGSFSSAFAPAE